MMYALSRATWRGEACQAGGSCGAVSTGTGAATAGTRAALSAGGDAAEPLLAGGVERLTARSSTGGLAVGCDAVLRDPPWTGVEAIGAALDARAVTGGESAGGVESAATGCVIAGVESGGAATGGGTGVAPARRASPGRFL